MPVPVLSALLPLLPAILIGAAYGESLSVPGEWTEFRLKKCEKQMRNDDGIESGPCTVWAERKSINAVRVRYVNVGTGLTWISLNGGALALLPGQTFVQSSEAATIRSVWLRCETRGCEVSVFADEVRSFEP
jgi:hypothetical protein